MAGNCHWPRGRVANLQDRQGRRYGGGLHGDRGCDEARFQPSRDPREAGDARGIHQPAALLKGGSRNCGHGFRVRHLVRHLQQRQGGRCDRVLRGRTRRGRVPVRKNLPVCSYSNALDLSCGRWEELRAVRQGQRAKVPCMPEPLFIVWVLGAFHSRVVSPACMSHEARRVKVAWSRRVSWRGCVLPIGRRRAGGQTAPPADRRVESSSLSVVKTRCELVTVTPVVRQSTHQAGVRLTLCR
mmetsp:Transcript_43658/g.108029  ORF Transcript_43658/g.108029 Transcript_43658/m.108029 type:complete len:241 (+) Transcript_43658:1920-2642(+)